MKTLIIAALVMGTSLPALADSPFSPRPLSLSAIERGTTAGGAEYTHYAVRCSNRNQPTVMTKVENRGYCVSNGTCKSDKIRAAQQSCRAGVATLEQAAETLLGQR